MAEPSTPEKYCEKKKEPVLMVTVEDVLTRCEKVEKWWLYSEDGETFYPTFALAAAHCENKLDIYCSKFTRFEIEQILKLPGRTHIVLY